MSRKPDITRQDRIIMGVMKALREYNDIAINSPDVDHILRHEYDGDIFKVSKMREGREVEEVFEEYSTDHRYKDWLNILLGCKDKIRELGAAL